MEVGREEIIWIGMGIVWVIVVRKGREMESAMGLIGGYIMMSSIIVEEEIGYIGYIIIIVYVGAIAILLMIITMMGEKEIKEREKREGGVRGEGVVIGMGIGGWIEGRERGERGWEVEREEWEVISGREIKVIGENMYTENIVIVGMMIMYLIVILGVVVKIMKRGGDN